MKKLSAKAVSLILFLALPQSHGDLHKFPLTASDKAFFDQIRKAVLSDDIEWFSKAVSYPIVLRPNSREIKVKNKRDLKEHARLIFTAQLKSTVQRQSSSSLFKNWQGVMVGN